MTINPLDLFINKPAISKHYAHLKQDLSLHYRHDLPGELEAPQGFTHHLITIFLTENPRQVTHFSDRQKYDGQMVQGEFYIYPAAVSGFTSWLATDETLHLIIKPDLLRKIAAETRCINPNKVELLPVLKNRDRQIEQLSQLFYLEMQNNSFGKQLYLESLTDLLGVHLLRNYCAFKPVFRTYKNGLASDKLRQTLDYINAYLDRDLSLEVMARQVDMSRCYFAAQFKQAMGISPHQYVNQQRVKKAQQLLQKKERSLLAIALDCGFASQSHFNKVFRQYVGTTPKKYQEQS